jgi:23S rRNA (guanine745-N1)-methyltransferase
MEAFPLHNSVFACPHCHLPLRVEAEDAQCAAGHCFDRAKEGYFNLLIAGRLPAQSTPGDTAESLAARRQFFATESYAPIAQALSTALGHVQGAILDVGCGEGYYLTHVQAEQKFAIDISKKAVQMASKRDSHSHCAVASAYRLPILDHSCSAVFSVFAPHSFEEYARVLTPGGRWVTITPGPTHLHQMRPHRDSAIDERERRRSEPPSEAMHAERVQFDLDLTDEASRNLFSMTPLVWQTAASASPVSHVSVDVWVATGTTP